MVRGYGCTAAAIPAVCSATTAEPVATRSGGSRCIWPDAEPWPARFVLKRLTYRLVKFVIMLLLDISPAIRSFARLHAASPTDNPLSHCFPSRAPLLLLYFPLLLYLFHFLLSYPICPICWSARIFVWVYSFIAIDPSLSLTKKLCNE